AGRLSGSGEHSVSDAADDRVPAGGACAVWRELMEARRGQATLEIALTFAAVTVPLTAAVVFTSQLLWVWHSVTECTRDGARYAVTHCWQGSGENVISYMRSHVPAMIDQDQFAQGGATIEVQYFQRNADTG